MTKQSPDGRYLVFSTDEYQNYPEVTPAARYVLLRDAIKHAESVTYKMAVVDSLAESRGFIYINWEQHPASSPWGPVQHGEQLAAGIWRVSTASHGGIWLSEDRLRELDEIMPEAYPTFVGDARWFEEDCDWCIPVIAFQLDGFDVACQQLRAMRGLRDKYSRAFDALVAAGKIPKKATHQQTDHREPSCDACLGQ